MVIVDIFQLMHSVCRKQDKKGKYSPLPSQEECEDPNKEQL